MTYSDEDSKNSQADAATEHTTATITNRIMVFSITLLAVSLAAFLGIIMEIGKDVNGT